MFTQRGPPSHKLHVWQGTRGGVRRAIATFAKRHVEIQFLRVRALWGRGANEEDARYQSR